MNYVFSTPANIDSNFTMTVLFVGLLVVLVVAGFHMSYRSDPSAMKLRTRCAIGVLVWTGVVSVSYVSNYSKFVSVDVSGENVTLHFSGSIYKDINLPSSNIGAVEFGFPDRGVLACNITFIDKVTGKRYQSAFTRNQHDTCKDLRLKIMQLLALPS